MLGRRQRLAGIAPEFLGDRCLVGLHDQLAERAGVLVLAGPHVQPRGPEVGIAAAPVGDVPIEKAPVEQPGGGAMSTDDRRVWQAGCSTGCSLGAPLS